MIKIGLLGIAHMHGYSYTKQLKSIDEVEVIGIYDHDDNKKLNASKKLDIIPFNEPATLINECDAVVVTSENSLHRKYTEMAARKGKHVLCEKPIATNEEDAISMLKCCEENKVILQMAFPVRYVPAVKKAKMVIDSGTLGEIVAVSSTNHGRMPGGWFVEPEKSGGGSVIDHTVHVVDAVRWMLGVEVTEVTCQMDRFIYDIKTEDCGVLFMKLSNGSFMTLDSSWSRPKSHPYWGDVTIRIVGTKGTIYIDAFNASLKVYSNEDGIKWENYGDNFDYYLVKDFVETIKNKNQPFTNGNDGLQSLRVALAAYESSKKKNLITL